jgi:hypothetical protein
MADRKSAHIASDGELLSRYALGRIDAAEREVVDRHTAGCSACMDALRQEMRIASGARRLGREELKAELKRKIGAAPQGAGWVRVLSAAAAVCIVAGLAVYYAWFTGGEPLHPLPVVSSPLAGKMETPRQDEGNAPARDLADKVKGDGTPESPVPSPGGVRAKQKEAASPAHLKLESERRGTGRRLAVSGAEGGAGTAEPAGGFWSEGIVESGEAARDAAAPRAAVTGREKSGALFQSNAVKKEEAGYMKDAPARPQGQYLLRQQPASTLPGDQERPAGDRQRVPTRVDRQGSTTTMTMYLDSLLDERDLKNARVEALTGDSVVVTLRGKKILYRFPPGQGAQQQRQK